MPGSGGFSVRRMTKGTSARACRNARSVSPGACAGAGISGCKPEAAAVNLLGCGNHFRPNCSRARILIQPNCSQTRIPIQVVLSGASGEDAGSAWAGLSACTVLSAPCLRLQRRRLVSGGSEGRDVPFLEAMGPETRWEGRGLWRDLSLNRLPPPAACKILSPGD